MTDSILLATDASNPQIVGAYNFSASAEERGKQLPKPAGYRILCAIPESEERFEESEFGLLKSDDTRRNEETLTTVLFVIELGPDCYKDPTRFPTGPWCKAGDFILVRPYSGSRLLFMGVSFGLLTTIP